MPFPFAVLLHDWYAMSSKGSPAILKRLTETKTMSLADVQDLLTEVDAMDGVGDGGLEPGVLRGLLGVLKQDMNAGVRTGEQQALDKIAQLHRYRK